VACAVEAGEQAVLSRERDVRVVDHQEVVFLDEVDSESSPMKAKGVGELGICGAAAAVANAIYNATGVRVRDYPITLDKLLAGMPLNA